MKREKNMLVKQKQGPERGESKIERGGERDCRTREMAGESENE